METLEISEADYDPILKLSKLIDVAKRSLEDGSYEGKDITEFAADVQRLISYAVTIRNDAIAEANKRLDDERINRTIMDNNGEEWEVVPLDTSDTYVHTMATIRYYYGYSSKIFNQYHSPAKPFFKLSRFVMVYCTGGVWALIPMIIASLG